MFLGELLVAILISMLLTVILSGFLGYKGPWTSTNSFFAALLLTTFGIGQWIIPFGPDLFGVYWLPYLAIGFILAIMLAAAAPAKPPKTTKEAVARAESGEGCKKGLDKFFWLLVSILAIGIFSSYLNFEHY